MSEKMPLGLPPEDFNTEKHKDYDNKFEKIPTNEIPEKLEKLNKTLKPGEKPWRTLTKEELFADIEADEEIKKNVKVSKNLDDKYDAEAEARRREKERLLAQVDADNEFIKNNHIIEDKNI